MSKKHLQNEMWYAKQHILCDDFVDGKPLINTLTASEAAHLRHYVQGLHEGRRKRIFALTHEGKLLISDAEHFRAFYTYLPAPLTFASAAEARSYAAEKGIKIVSEQLMEW